MEDELRNAVNAIVKLRDELRKVKQWELADLIRDSYKKLGIIMQDTWEGTKWRFNGTR